MIRTGLLLWLATAAPSAPADVMARVDDLVITRADLDERLRVLGQRRVPPAQALENLVDEALLAAEARRLGLERDPSVVDEIDVQRRRLAADAHMASVAASFKPTDEQLRGMYHASGDQVRLTLAKFSSETEARAALERVKKGGDLAAEARRSLDPTLAARGGDTGQISRALVDPALTDFAFRAPLGTIIGPVQLSLGWAIARVVERSISDEGGFPERREALAEMARSRASGEIRAHAIDRLKRSSGVTLDEPFLESLRDRVEVTPAELDHVVAKVNGRPLAYRFIHPQAVQLFRTVRGHGIGGRARVEIAWKEVDARLLSDDAIAKGFDRSPAVTAVLPCIERNILAAAAAAKIGKVADLRDPAVRARIDTLRQQAKVQVERGRIAAYGAAR